MNSALKDTNIVLLFNIPPLEERKLNCLTVFVEKKKEREKVQALLHYVVCYICKCKRLSEPNSRPLFRCISTSHVENTLYNISGTDNVIFTINNLEKNRFVFLPKLLE